jgi:hypothetical protein
VETRLYSTRRGSLTYQLAYKSKRLAEIQNEAERDNPPQLSCPSASSNLWLWMEVEALEVGADLI